MMKETNHHKDAKEEPLERPPLIGWLLVSVILLVLVEVCWLGAAYRSLMIVGDLASLPIGIVTMTVMMLVAYGTAYLLEYLRLLHNIRLVLYGVLLLISLIVGGKVLLPSLDQNLFLALFNLEPGAIFVFFFVLWLWWRGINLARVRLRPEIAWGQFQVGLVAFLTIVFLSHWMGGEAPGLGWFATFLFIGFMAVLSARAAYVDVSAGEQTNPLNRRWIGGMAALLGLLVILTAVLGSLMTGQGALLLDWLAQIIRFVVAAIFLIMGIPALIFGVIFGGFMGWLRRALGLEGTEIIPEQDLELFNLGEFDLPPPSQESLPAYVQSLLFWSLVLIGVIWLFVLLRRRAERWRRPDLGEPESLLEPGDAGRLIRKAVQDAVDDWLNRLRLTPKPDLPVVRKIYIKLLNLAVDLEQPRAPTKTPLEFQDQLSKKLAGVEQDLEKLTKVYMDIRYGELSESQADITQAEAALRAIEVRAQKLN